MTCAGCRSAITDSRVKVEEGGKKATFINESRETLHRTRVDGCLLVNEVGADFVVSKVGVGDVIVELKGKDVEHAAEQIIATAEFMGNCEELRGPLAGLVICAQYPRIDTRLQRLATQFAKRFKGPIHVVSKSGEFVFEKVLSFKGPR